MRKVVSIGAAALLVLSAAVPAFAAQPDQGTHSEGRNEAGFGGGPHCHINLKASAQQEVFEFIAAYPSHRAHIATGVPVGIFAADPDCDGAPGL